MAVPLAERILKVVDEGLGLWKTFIATRQEAYNRQQDKKQVRAIEAAEKGFFAMDDIIAKIDPKEFKKEIAAVKRYRKHFFHYH
jgi:hypothetical protein